MKDDRGRRYKNNKLISFVSLNGEVEDYYFLMYFMNGWEYGNSNIKIPYTWENSTK